MLTLSQRIWISFITVLAVAISLSYVIKQSGDKVSTTTQYLVTVQLPKLALIKRLRASVTEHERLLYEYYTTTNRELVWPKIVKQDRDFREYMHSINESFSGHIMDLPSLYGEIKFLRQSLDQNLGSQDINWEKSRFDLANLTLAGQQAEAILSTLTDKIQDEAWQGAESTQEQISNIINLVLTFALIIIVVAMFIGYYTQANIKKTAKRRALAKFPERNPNPVMNLNWQGQILFGNPACQELLQIINTPTLNLEELLPVGFFRNLKIWQHEHKTQVKFDAIINQRNLHYSLSLLPDLESCHLYIEDVSERIKAQAQLTFQALHDVHTGLPNRRQFETILSEMIKQAKPCSIIFISIDRFKFITSSQGYHIGDLIIKFMGQRLSELCDFLNVKILNFRLEGSTFCLLIDSSDQSNVIQVINDLQGKMDEPLCVEEHRYYLNLSLGVCHYPQDGQSAQTLITNGNAALNHARIQGDCSEQYSSKLHAAEQSWLPIEAGMRTALEQKQFVLHYQAKVDAQNTQIKGAEALIRWIDNDGKMISPGLFIPIAEQTGLIIKIGQWVLEEGCRQAKAFSKENKDIQLAINISARQFQHRHFLRQLKEILELTQADPSTIELEITESLIMENAQHSISIMKKLKDMGFALAIDDFGTGYSSLSYLKQFPIDTLKVDQAFIRNLESDDKDKSIVRAIIDLAKHLDLKTVAEGVETQGQWHFLKDLECDYIQGYLFSKPGNIEYLTTQENGFIYQK